MKIDEVITFVGVLFGTGGILHFVTDRNKKRIENRALNIDVLQSIQKAYDSYVADSNTKYTELKQEIIHLTEKLNVVTSLLEEEKTKRKDIEKQLKDCLESGS